MTEEEQPRQRNRKRLWLILAALIVILAILIVPPFLSVSRYKSRITQLISTSLGRPVRLSSVEVRLLPRPGFLLTDLTVAEDPAYGAEPVLHANTVTASIRLLSLWRGRLELDTISVDEASLNLVRTGNGPWNLDSLLRSATAQAQSASGSADPGKPVRLPYLEATNSRINIKNGVEKLPFSLDNAKMSLWQEKPGDWRVRLRGQPVRTDLSSDQNDTGVVRLEASLHQAPQLRQMPVHLDLEWREAQLGQFTRLLLGADARWRGDLTVEVHLDGTAEAAQIKTRLRATGVRRAEFAPAEPMDFDAKCSLVAHFSARAIDNLLCDSPLGKGHIRLNGDLPGQSGQPRVSVELDRIPAAVGLDALRTVRSGLAPGLVAAGSASGKLTYAPVAPVPEIGKPAHSAKSSAHPQVVSPLSGSIAVEGLQLTGGGLAQPLIVPKFLLESAANQPQDASQALSATVAIPAGATAPLTVSTRFALSGYQISLHGPVSIQRGRELAHLAGLANASALDALAGDPLSLDLTAEGPWSTIQSPVHSLPSQNVNLGIAATQSLGAPADTLTGTVVLRDANWKADYLANHVEISQATLHFSPDELRWDPIVFSYGPLKGTAILTQPVACTAVSACPTRFQLQFGALDSAVFQAAFLGAKAKGTLLSTLIDRFRSTATPPWPAMKGTVKAESLVLGPVTLRDFTSEVSTLPNGAELTSFDAALLGGRLHGSGTIHTAASAKDKPSYQFEGHFDKLSPPLVGHLLGQRWSRGSFDGNAKIELAGFAGSDLADSAKGSLHFEWQGGTVAPPPASIPPSLARFDRWTADAEIANGSLTLKESQVKRGPHSEPVQATVTLTDPPKVAFDAPRQPPAKR